MMNSVLVRRAIETEEADSGPNLSMAIDPTDPYSDLGSVSQHYDEIIDKLAQASADEMPDLQDMYDTIQFCKTELASLRKEIDALKKRANKSFATIFQLLQPEPKVENSDQSVITVDSNESDPYPEEQDVHQPT